MIGDSQTVMVGNPVGMSGSLDASMVESLVGMGNILVGMMDSQFDDHDTAAFYDAFHCSCGPL